MLIPIATFLFGVSLIILTLVVLILFIEDIILHRRTYE